MRAETTLARATPRSVWTLAVAACVAIAVCALLLVAGFRQRELSSARKTVSGLDAVLAEETARSLQNVALVLDALVTEAARDGVATGEDLARLRSDADTRALMRARAAGLPQVEALTLVDAAGHAVNSTREGPTPSIDLSDREYFRRVRDAEAPGTVLGAPGENRVTGVRTAFVARRIAGPDGSFAGAAIATVGLDHFTRFYRSLDLEDGLGVSLWLSDGSALARMPPLPPGAGAVPPPWAERPGADRGVYTADAEGGLPARIVAYRRVPGFDAVVSVSIPRSEALADWTVLTVGAAAATMALVAGTLLLAVLATRHLAVHTALGGAVAAAARADAEREASEAQLRQSQKMEAIGHLTGGIAHDFNNMLAIVVGNLDIAGRRLARGGDALPHIESAMDGARRAAALTQRLLAFSRRQQLAPRVVEANAFVAGAADLVGRTVGRSHRFRYEPAPGRWRVEVDESQLENALINLALNARDATPEGGSITLRTSFAKLKPEGARPAGDYVVVGMSDDGHGMDAETLQRATDPFFTTKPVGQGTGLGLSQAYGFARQSGGFLRIESTPGAGTTVSIALPRTLASPGRQRVPDAVPKAAPGGETVLLVDDEEAVRTAAAEMLRELGYGVVETSEPGEALAALANGPAPALLLTDVGMPMMDGRVLAARAREAVPGLPVLLATGQAMAEVEAGTRVLSKPFDMRRLAEGVRSAIDAGRTDVIQGFAFHPASTASRASLAAR